MIKVYTGTQMKQFVQEFHPAHVVLRARDIIRRYKKEGTNRDVIHYFYNPEFVSAIRYISEKEGILDQVEFFLNRKSQGTEIEGIFKSFNKAISLLNRYGL